MQIAARSSVAGALLIAILACASSASAQTVIAAPGQTVATGADGKQILFRDKTSITAGANSTITVKRVEYNAGGTPNVVIDVSKGAFRYITGDAAGSHTVKTPLSTVGVRGTVIEGFVDANGFEVFALMEGALEVCTPAACQPANTPGTFVVVFPGGKISPPAGIPAAMMSAMLVKSPSVDLVREYLFETVNTGGDPLVRFRDLNEIANRLAAVPPDVPDDGGEGHCGPGHGGNGHGGGHGGHGRYRHRGHGHCGYGHGGHGPGGYGPGGYGHGGYGHGGSSQ